MLETARCSVIVIVQLLRAASIEIKWRIVRERKAPFRCSVCPALKRIRISERQESHGALKAGVTLFSFRSLVARAKWDTAGKSSSGMIKRRKEKERRKERKKKC
jgi:hypothetical protein